MSTDIAKSVEISGFGNFSDLERSLERVGIVADESNKRIARSASDAGRAAAMQARQAGASADEQVAAAGRTAAAYVDSQAAITRAQKAAGDAAAAAARRIGLSVDEQRAAYARAVADAEKAGGGIGTAFEHGTSRAGGALKKLGSLGSSWGIPFSGSLEKMGHELDQAGSKAEKFHAAVADVGKITLVAGGGGLVAASYEAVKLGASYETSQAKIQSSTNIGVHAASELTHAFQGTAGHFMQSGQELEGAYASVAGQLQATEGHALSTGEAFKFMSAAADLADGTGAQLVPTTAAVASILQAFGLRANEAGRAADTLYSTSQALKVPVESLATSLAKLHGRLGQAAPSLGDISALMVSLGEHGIQGSRGVMVANTAIQTLVGGSKTTDEVLKALGVHVFDAQGHFLGLQGVIGQLQPKLAGLTEQERFFAEKALFGSSAAQVMGQVVQSGVPAFQRATQEANRTGAAHQAAAKQAETLHGEMETLKSSLTTIAGDFGTLLIPEIKEFSHVTSEAIGWMEKHKTEAYLLGGAITLVLGAAVTVYAEQKAVQFGKATVKMMDDLSKLASWTRAKTGENIASFEAEGAAAAASAEKVGASAAEESAAVTGANQKIEASNSAAGESFAAEAAAAEAAAGGVEGAAAESAAAVASADAKIEASNAAAGASFAGLASKIGMVGIALAAAEVGAHGLGSALEAITGEKQAKSLGELLGGTNEHTDEGQAGIRAWNRAQRQKQLDTGGGIMAFFEAKGLTPAEAAGVVGNFQQESKLNFKERGGGIDQGLGSRDHSRLNSVGQLEAIWQEMVKGEGGVLRIFREHPNMGPSEAARLFSERFERPGEPMLSNRERYATEAFRDHPKHHGAGQPAHAFGNSPHYAPSAALQEYMEQAAGGHARHSRQKVEAYADPFAHARGLHAGRTDMGLDVTAAPGSPIDAIGAGVINAIVRNWYKGQPLIEETLTSGSRKGQHVYYAEQINPNVRVGEHLTAGEMIGRVAASGTGLELGFGAGGGRTLAQATSGYHEGQVTTAGTDFRKFLASIGKGGTVLSVAVKQAEAFEALVRKLEGKGHGELKTFQNAIQGGSLKQLEKVTGYTAHDKTGAHSEAGHEFHGLVSALKGTHDSALKRLAKELVSAHKEALKALRQELKAAQLSKESEAIKLQTTEMRDRQQLATDTSAAQLAIAKAQEQQTVDSMRAGTQQITDMTQLVTDRFSAMAQAIEDHTREMGDASNAVVEGIRDQTQIKVDLLGERGLYGLNLVAQQQQVQLDVMKASYDQQIAQAQIALDHTKALWDGVVAQKQQIADEVQLQSDQKIALAQSHADSVGIEEAQRLGTAQEHLDSVVLAEDIDVALAQTAVTLSAGMKKSQQDAAKAQLEHAQATSSKMVQEAQGQFAKAQSSANEMVQQSQGELARSQEYAAKSQAEAKQAVAQAQGEAGVAIANATQSLQSIQDTAAQAESEAESAVNITKAEAATQYAGSGTTIHITGINPTDSSAIASEIGWLMRTQIPA